MGRYPGSRSNSVGMSVEPWIDACPRSARMPPPGRPILPSSACRIDAARMYCTVPLEYLEHAPRVLKRRVGPRRADVRAARAVRLAARGLADRGDACRAVRILRVPLA